MQTSLITNITKWLNQPFPFYENYKQKVFIPVLLSLLVMAGIIILTPYKNADIFFKQIIDVFKYGSIVIFISLIFSLALPEIAPKIFNSETWNIKKTLVLLLLSIVTIAISITVFVYFFDNPNHKHFYFYVVRIFVRSITLSFLPIIILVFYFERLLHRKNYLRAIEIIDELKTNRHVKPNRHKKAIYTFAKNTKDEIKIPEHELFYVKAQGNYCLLIYKQQSNLMKQLIRSSLKDIEEIISTSNHFLRCHKSYIVNLDKVSNITGNAKGYTFYLDETESTIPASRNLSKSLIKRIKTTNIKN